MLNADFIDNGNNSIGHHLLVGPKNVVVKHNHAIRLNLSRGHICIAPDGLVAMISIDINPIEIMIRELLEAGSRIHLVQCDRWISKQVLATFQL